MRVEAITGRALVALLFACSAAPVGAFEPGTTRVCEPSADRSRFECRDARTGETEREATRGTPRPEPGLPPRAEPAVAEAPAAVVDRDVPAASQARSLPNYLMQNPAPLSSGTPVDEAPREPASRPTDASTSLRATPLHVEPTAPASRAAVPDAPLAPATAPATDTASGMTASAPATQAPEQAAMQADPVERKPVAAPVPAAPHVRHDADAFRRLDATHYTVEIARARSAGELGALVAALDGITGALYLIGLRTPDGISHSLVWSAFPTIEAAREARHTLPADVAVTSGWPRRIGPLQAELIDP